MSLSILLQHVLPLRWMTGLAGRLAESRRPAVAQTLIRAFMRKHGIDLSEAVRSQPDQYQSFNDFFTRALRPGARPLATVDWISPVDGEISQVGRIEAGQVIQAKQQAYSAEELLGDADLARHFEAASYTTLYLSPRDYHRVHMPCEGVLLGMRYLPGKLLSVRPDIVQGVEGLLARNERLVCWFEHPRYGVFAMVLVGAAIVGSIATTWHGVLRAGPRRAPELWRYESGDAAHPQPSFQQGEEMGRFQLGSTVIVLMPRQAQLSFHPEWQVGQRVQMGQAMADLPSEWPTL